MQYQNIVTVVLLVCAFGASQALFFGRDNAIARSQGRAVNQTCLAKADAGDCGFYTCFENRLSCGRDWYILKIGQFYCNRMNQMMDTFTDDAQEFIRDSQICLMQSLKDTYAVESIECHDLEHLAIAAVSRCFRDNAFCSALHGNYQEFFQIYEVDDLVSTGAGKVWAEIARLAMTCGGEALGAVATGVQQQLSNLGDHISNLGNHVSNALDNAADSAQTHLSNFANNAEEALSNAGEEVSDALGDAAEEVRSRFSNLFSWKKK